MEAFPYWRRLRRLALPEYHLTDLVATRSLSEKRPYIANNSRRAWRDSNPRTRIRSPVLFSTELQAPGEVARHPAIRCGRSFQMGS